MEPSSLAASAAAAVVGVRRQKREGTSQGDH